MKCERLTLVNFCKIRHRVIEFGDGMTAIIGPNGSGKSSIFGGLSFALTGANPNFGVKTDNICDLAPATETSYVELSFTHGATSAVVRRNIRPARPTATLRINGVETVEGDTDVTARIQQILGIPMDILNDIVIVGQEEIFGFVSKTAAKRAEQFQKLFGTGHAAVIYKLIGDQLKTVEIPAVGVDRDTLISQLATTSEALAAARATLVQYPTHQQIQEIRDQNTAVVTAYNNQQRMQQQLQTAYNQYNQLRAAKQASQDELTRLDSERRQIEESKTQWDKPAEQARLALLNLSATRQRVEARGRAVVRVQQLQAQLQALRSQVPQLIDHVGDIAAAEKRRSDIDVKWAEHDRFVRSFTPGVCECPTCQTPVTTLMDRLDTSRKALESLSAQGAALAKSIKASREYDRQIALYDASVSGLEAQLATADAQLADLPNESTENIDEASTRITVTTHKTFVDGLAEYDQLIMNSSKSLARWDGQITQLSQQIVDYETELTKLPTYTDEICQQAQNNVTQWDITASDRRQLEIQVASREAEVMKLHDQIAAADRVAAAATMLRGWHQFAETVRGVFHKDAAPRFVAQRNLEHLQVSINESLERFGAEYRVTADEGLSFMCRFVDGSVQPAERISVGQRVVLALSFRLALNLMCAENIGAIYLDEPTAWLDETTIKAFEPVLTQLRDFSAARGLQSIIITHERGLAPLFDTVIQL